MLSFEKLNVCDEIKSILMQYRVDFVFQPIFDRLGKIYGYEALMRPEGKNVLEYIEEVKHNNMLHELELVSFFGATMAYRQRNYDKKLCINSFPSECFSVKEAKCYSDCFKPIKDKLVIEIIEYTEGERWMWKTKQAHTRVYEGIEVSIDDFGTGHNDIDSIDYYNPNIVKLDRSLISNIDAYSMKQKDVKYYIEQLHNRGIRVLAEGVETQKEYEFLFQAGVDLFQGYLLAKPA